MTITRTPYRIGLAGGGLDRPELFEKAALGAPILNGAMNKYLWVTVNRRVTDEHVVVRYSQEERVNDVSEIKHDLVRMVLQEHGGNEWRRSEITIVGELPGNSGIGSSAALTVGLIHALKAERGERATQSGLAAEAVRLEALRLGPGAGVQDPWGCALPGWKVGWLGPAHRLWVTVPAKNAAFDDSLEIVWTGRQRNAGKYLREAYESGHQDWEARLANSIEIIKCWAEGINGPADRVRLGRLLEQNDGLKGRHGAHGDDDLADIYEREHAKDGARGKLMGAGGGGFILLVRPDGRHNRNDEERIPIGIDHHGTTLIHSE